MDILLIIYIFALFVIFSPNLIFNYSKTNNILVVLLHAIIFSIVVYITYNSVINTKIEGATIGTLDKNNVSYPLEVNEMDLGGVIVGNSDIEEPKDVSYNNEIVVSTPNSAEEDKLTTMPPYDYTNFRTYDYENMKKKINMLESHKHTNHYFDLVPNFNQTRHEVLCAADYGTNKPCCRQPNAFIPEVNQCTALKPYCKDYITGKQWGACVSTNPYPTPNLVYDSPINKVLDLVSPSGEIKPKKVVVVEKEYITKYINNCPASAPAPPAASPPPPAASPPPPAASKTPITQANIKDAVNLWISDKPSALTTYGEINTWDTSAVTDMFNLFSNKTSFNDDISGWNTSNVRNMQQMFYGAVSFDQNIRSWDVSMASTTLYYIKVVLKETSTRINQYPMFEMFSGATKMIENQGAPVTPTKAYFSQ